MSGEGDVPGTNRAAWINHVAFGCLLLGLLSLVLNDKGGLLFLALLVFFPLKAAAEWMRASASPVGSRDRRRAMAAAGVFLVLGVGGLAWLVAISMGG